MILFPTLLLAPFANCLSTGSSVAEDAAFIAARRGMVTEQLAIRGITNQRVLQVMSTVPRHELVPPEVRSLAYGDYPLPIGYGQTISQPYIVAFITQALNLRTNDVVLEIGTGSGYQTAVLAGLVKQVYSIEIVEPLARRAEADLQRLSITNAQVRVGDGYKGWPTAAPFDAIIVTCAPDHAPQPLVDQLKEGGCMIIPVGLATHQSLYLLRKEGGKVRQQEILPVRFVSMTGQAK